MFYINADQSGQKANDKFKQDNRLSEKVPIARREQGAANTVSDSEQAHDSEFWNENTPYN